MKTIKYLLILIPFLSFAQSKFEKGYIKTTSGERTECFIKNDDWKSNPAEFVYKLSLDSEAKTGNVKNISEFGIDDFSKYVSATVEVDKTSLDMNNYDSDRTPKFNYETVFLKVLKEADISLYSYEENNLHLYFIKASSNKIEQLINKPYRIDENKIDFYQYYKQQLINSLQCEGLKADIEKTAYLKSSLIQLFDKYYKCSGQTTKEVSKDKGKTEIKLYVTPGIKLRSFSLERAGETADADFGSIPGLRIGAELEAVLPFNNGKWTLFIEPNYETYSGTKEIPTYGEVKVEGQTIFMPVGIRHYFPLNGNSKLFLDFAYNLLLSDNSKGSYETTDEDFEVKSKSNLVLGFGYAYRKFRLAVKYELNDSVESTNYSYIRPESKAISFVLGYNFL